MRDPSLQILRGRLVESSRVHVHAGADVIPRRPGQPQAFKPQPQPACVSGISSWYTGDRSEGSVVIGGDIGHVYASVILFIDPVAHESTRGIFTTLWAGVRRTSPPRQGFPDVYGFERRSSWKWGMVSTRSEMLEAQCYVPFMPLSGPEDAKIAKTMRHLRTADIMAFPIQAGGSPSRTWRRAARARHIWVHSGLVSS